MLENLLQELKKPLLTFEQRIMAALLQTSAVRVQLTCRPIFISETETTALPIICCTELHMHDNTGCNQQGLNMHPATTTHERACWWNQRFLLKDEAAQSSFVIKMFPLWRPFLVLPLPPASSIQWTHRRSIYFCLCCAKPERRPCVITDYPNSYSEFTQAHMRPTQQHHHAADVKRVRPSVAAALWVTRTAGHSRGDQTAARILRSAERRRWRRKEKKWRKINSLLAGNSNFLAGKNAYR